MTEPAENNDVKPEVDAGATQTNTEPSNQTQQETSEQTASQEAATQVEDIDWRKEMAGDDDKILSLLGRYNTKDQVAKALFELRTKLSSGEYKKNTPPPTDAAELSEWRKENKIPEDFSGYKMPEGFILGDADKPVVEAFLKTMHESNVADGIPQKAVEWYLKAREETAAASAEADRAQRMQTEETLRGEWGPEYRANMNMTESFVKERFGDIVGEALLSSPDMVRAMANIAREINPMITVVPNSADPVKSMQDELDHLRSKMRNLDTWAKDTKGQARFIELTASMERFKK